MIAMYATAKPWQSVRFFLSSSTTTFAVRTHFENYLAATPIKSDTPLAPLKGGIVKHALAIAFLACLFLTTLTPFAAEKNTLRDPQLRRLYQSLKQPVVADSSFIITDTLRLNYPDFALTLRRGELVPLRDSTETLTGFFFEGAAQIAFRPRHVLERQQLQRFTGDSVAVLQAARLLIRVSKPNVLPARILANEAFHQTKTKKAEDARELQRAVHEALLDRRGYNLAAHMLTRRIGGEADSLIVCAFYPEGDRNLFPPLCLYVYDALSLEQVSYLQYSHKKLGRPMLTVCSYPLVMERLRQINRTLRITKYNGWVQIEDDGKIHADLGFDFFTAHHRPEALFFSLSSDLKVLRISGEAGDTLAFAQEPKEQGVTVFLTPRIWLSDTLRLFLQYEGEALRRHDNGTMFLKDAINWVPRFGYLARAHYHLVFKSSPRWRVLSVGERVRDWDEPSFHLSFYKTRVPAKASTFCLGRFVADTLARQHASLPRIEIHSTPRRSARERRRVAGDIANSLHFYERLLGPYPLPSIRVVESPNTHSQGFPGFVTLSWVGFASQLSGAIEALRSHEVAHQWFGNLIGWATYHDQWLSEAFAEYLGAMYVEWIAREPGAFDQLLAAWRDDIIEGGHIGVSLGMQRFGLGKEALRKAEGMKAGPLWLGYRLGQNEAVDYYSHVYEKGAYVLHMLRWLMRDLATGSDEKFWQMLADFLRHHAALEPATEDFQRVAEAHYGAPLDWFFQQWIYRSEVPTYRWSYNLAQESEPPQVGMPVAQGAQAVVTTQVLRLKITQENVSRDFKMPVPIKIEYFDGTSAMQRVWVTHEGGELNLSLRPERVKSVHFNFGEAVLARVKNELKIEK